ncbi:MAG TPA: NUDIX hydrolase [Gammaproteobacteria bacterium]|nr:NUDIX hydrolase [Gammaproteobacteria bacterium]
MNYCSHCGQPVEQCIPEGDNLPRHVCTVCHAIHYENPKIVAGCIGEWEDRILLCRRAIEPRHGLWTLPAGFMENRESTREAALRETWEEARTRVDIQSLYAVYSIPHISQVYMVFRGPLIEPVYAAGPESLAVELFREQDIPWETLAFPVMEKTLRQYFSDRDQGRHQSATHEVEIARPMGDQP